MHDNNNYDYLIEKQQQQQQQLTGMTSTISTPFIIKAITRKNNKILKKIKSSSILKIQNVQQSTTTSKNKLTVINYDDDYNIGGSSSQNEYSSEFNNNKVYNYHRLI